MTSTYSPFRGRQSEKTEHGIINYRNKHGTSYITFRNKNHFFKKFQGFGVSKTELELAYNKRIKWIVIIYDRNKEESIVYRTPLNKTRFFEEYSNKGDIQKIIPVKEMEKLCEEGWRMY